MVVAVVVAPVIVAVVAVAVADPAAAVIAVPAVLDSNYYHVMQLCYFD